MTANVTLTNYLLLKRANTSVSSTYTGLVGEITIDTDLDTVRVHDGVTAGGHILANVSQINSNINLSAVNANVAAANLTIASTNANIGAFQTYANIEFTDLWANAATQTIALDNFIAETGFATSANLGAYQIFANANIGAYQNYANVTFAELSANLGNIIVGTGFVTQTQLINNVNIISANVGNFQIFSNANAAIQSQALFQANIDHAANIIAANASISALQTNAAMQQTQITALDANIGSIITGTGFASLDQLNANVGILNTKLRVNVEIISANLGAYQIFANANSIAQSSSIDILLANAGTQATSINSLNANIGAYQIFANANVASIQANLGVTQIWANANIATINANLGAYQTYANANSGSLQANLGAYQTYANANAAVQTNEINNLFSNAGVQATSINLVNANVTAANSAITALTANAATQAGLITTVNANVTAANAAITSLQSNAAVQQGVLDVLSGNAVTQTLELQQLTSNAAVQAANLTVLLANAVSQQNSLTVLVSNAATQSTAIDSINANVGAYQTFANANAATQATSITTLLSNTAAQSQSLDSLTANAATQGASIINIDANLGTATTNITALQANAGAQGSAIDNINANVGAYQIFANANAAAQAGSLTTLIANAATQAQSLDSLTSNAATQAASINTIDANLGVATTNITALQSNAGSQAAAINNINANVGAYQTLANANVVAIQANLGAYQTYANANVVAIQANLGAYQSYANANVVAIQTNISAYQSYANANVVAIQTNISAYQSYANANAAAQAVSITSLTANAAAQQLQIDSFVTGTGFALITQLTANVDTINANIGAFQTFANANAATQTTEINSLRANITAANTLIPNLSAVSGNILPNANVTYSLGSAQFQWKDLWVSNNTIYIGNTPVRVDGGTLLVNGAPVSGGSTYGNANVATYLPTYTGNIAGNIVKNGYTWTFGTGGNLTVPAGGTITAPIAQEFRLQARAADSVLRNEIELDPNNGTYMSVWSDGTTSFSSADWDTGSWNNESGLGAARFTDAQSLQNFWTTGIGSLGLPIEASINGGARTPNVFYDNNNGEQYGVFLGLDAVPPGGQGTTVPITSLVFYYQTQSKINMDVDGGEILVDAQSMDLDLRTTLNLDLRAGENLNLRGLGQYPVRIYTDNSTHMWEFDTSGSLILPSEGKINGIGAPNDRYGYMSWTGNTSGDGSGYNTIRLVPDLQGLEDVDTYIILDPAYDGQTGNIHIRAGGTRDNSLANLYLGGANSHVKIGAGVNPPVTVKANSHSWTFSNTGTTTFPTGVTLSNARGANTVNFLTAVDKSFQIETQTNATSKLWNFTTDGNLTLPQNANINFANGVSILAGITGTYGNTQVAAYLPTYTGNIAGNIVKNGNVWTFGTNGTTRFPNSTILAPAGQNITMQSDQYSQLMWENANLTVAPDMAINSNFYVAQNNATLDIGYRDGSSTQIIKSWLWSADGSLTLPAGGVIAEGGGISGAIRLTPAGGANSNQALLIYPTGNAEGDHVHLTAGGGSTELYLGNDFHYVKLVDGGNIELRAATANLSSQAAWTFDTTGNVDTIQALGIKVPNGVPSNVAVINSTTGSWEANPRSNLATTGGSGSGLTVNVTETGGYASTIAIATAGTGYTNGDLITVTSGSSNATFTIVIGGRNTWQFSTDGATTLPGDIYSGTGAAIKFSKGLEGDVDGAHLQVSNITFLPNVSFEDIPGLNLGLATAPAIGWTMQSMINSWTANGAVNVSSSTLAAPYSDSGNIGTIALGGPSGTGSIVWAGETDRYALSGNTLAYEPYGNIKGLTVGSSANVIITSNVGPVESFRWIFGANANLTLPETGYLRVGSGIVAGFASSPAPVISGFSSISAENFRFQGNGVNILSTVGAGSYGNANVASYLLNFDGDIEFTSSTARIGNVDVITVGDHIRSPAYQFSNGTSILAGITGTYSNTNVAAYLTTATITTTGNITAGNVSAVNFVGTIQAQVGSSFAYATDAYGSLFNTAGVPLPADTNSNAIVAGYTIVGNSGAVTLTVTSATFIPGTPNIVQVATTPSASSLAYPVTVYSANYSPAIPTSTITVGNATVTGNITAGNLTTSGTFTVANITTTGAYGNITGANVISANTVSATNYLFANGVNILSTVTAGSTYSNANVATFLAAYGSNTISTTGNITAGNVSATRYNFANGVNILSNVVSKTTGSWTVTTGTNTYSIQLAENGTYQIWVDCNIPNGILAYNATATVTNGNVPVVGVQYAWVYDGGGTPIDFTSIPNQFTGTANTIVRSSVAPSATTNRFDFGINNTSGGNVTVRYGWIAIS